MRTLGEGGFSEVYDAVHHHSGERVALKELSRPRPDALARFKQEFRAMQHLHHRNLVALRELFEFERRWFIAMEFVPGTDWLSAVRRPGDNDNAPRYDEARLLETLSGVSQGLIALHRAGLLHRDLKPANIRVTPEGRAVLLDFGLITTRETSQQSTEAVGRGSVAYMAPEQAAGAKLGPAADWYSVGVCLYEALTGRLPFVGNNALQIMMDKQHKLPERPSTLNPSIPADLDRLCMHLLEPDPMQRASAERVTLALSKGTGASADDPLAVTGMAPSLGVPFTGRTADLEFLERAFAKTSAGSPQQVVVEGESGMGKSGLVQEFLDRLDHAHADAVVLRGRCYENEAVPFKGFDGVMDSLSRYLRRLDEGACHAVLPRWSRLLQQVFPVMGMVPPLAKSPLKGVPAEPTARRIATITALRDLLSAISDRHPLVIVVDDVQWADLESFQIFDMLTVDPERPPVLLLLTCRPMAEVSAELQPPLEALRKGSDAEVLTLRGLARSETRSLAGHLLGPATDEAWIEQIVDESEGHPLFISELAHYALEAHGIPATQLTLDGVLSERIRKLDPEVRTLLETTALAASPKPAEVLYGAAGLAANEGASAARLLRAQKLIGTGRSGRVRCYHDRIRATVVRVIPEDREREMHHQLALALADDADADPAEVGTHFDAAHQFTQARLWLQRAADAALETLGFARAESLYARCLEILEESAPDHLRRTLLIGHGHALARAGRSSLAAQQYERAASLGDQETSVQLRVWAAQHALQAAEVEEGIGAARAVLAELRLKLPEQKAGTMARWFWDRTCLAVRGLKVSPRDPNTLDPLVRLRLEALASLSAPVGWVDPLSAATMGAMHLRLALKAGDPEHVSQALSNEAGFRCLIGDPDACQSLLQRSQELAQLAGGDGHSTALHKCIEGNAAFFGWRLEEAEAYFEEAETLVRQCAPNDPWLLNNLLATRGSLWAARGEYGRLRAATSRWLKEADARRDRFAGAALMALGGGFFSFLMADQPEEGVREISERMLPWPSEMFSVAQFGEMMAVNGCLLYQGGDRSHAWLQRREKRLDSAMILKGGIAKETVELARCQAALGALGGQPDATQATSLARQVDAGARTLRKRAHYSRAMGLLISAQHLALQGKPEPALQAAGEAAEALEKLGHVGHRSASYLMGVLEGGEGGRARRDAVESFLKEQGWENTAGALRMLLPAIDAVRDRYR